MLHLILFTGIILRIINLKQSLRLDEAINVLATQHFSFLGMVTEYAKADFHPPGFFIILWIWTHFFGPGEISVRVPSVVFGVLTIYAVYLLGQKLYSRTLGLFSALLLAVNPLHIYYSQDARMYALATLAVSLNALIFVKLIKGEKINSLLLILSNLLVLSSDYVAYLIFPAQLLIFILTKQHKFIKIWLMALGAALLLGVWWIPILIDQLNIGAVTSSRLPTWKFVVGGFDAKANLLTLVKFIIGRISMADKVIYYLMLLPVSSFFLFLLFKGACYIKNPGRIILICWLLVPIILATLISLIVPIYSYFRLMFTLPAFLILISLGIISSRGKLKYIFIGIVLLVQVLSSSIYLFNKSFHREDWKGLVDYFRSNDRNIIILFESSGTLPPFDYYAGKSLIAKGALQDFPAKDMNAVSQLENLVRNYQEIYLIDYLVQISDANRLVAKKLLELGYKEADIKNFNGVGFVYHYVKSN